MSTRQSERILSHVNILAKQVADRVRRYHILKFCNNIYFSQMRQSIGICK